MLSIKYKTIFFAILFSVSSCAAFAEIIIQPTPDQGLQPRLTVDNNGDVHLLYFKKRINRPASREGNLYYRSYDHKTGQFTLPVKVSSSAFSMQTFSIARASMAITEDGRVHAFWYYPRSSEMIYSRSNPERTVSCSYLRKKPFVRAIAVNNFIEKRLFRAIVLIKLVKKRFV